MAKNRAWIAAFAAMAGLALAGCGTTETVATAAPTPNATNAPVGAGVDIVPGSKEDYIVNVGRRTFFSEGSTALSEATKDTLDKQAQFLLKYTRYKVKIQGFADDPGSKEANLELGKKRAEAVRTYLSAKGVPETRMRVKTYGNSKERLVNDCPDISCKSQNRRVVTNIESEVDS
jgi:peptidoglycan-associated lipoprotein